MKPQIHITYINGKINVSLEERIFRALKGFICRVNAIPLDN